MLTLSIGLLNRWFAVSI